jgi:hypothetical protein
MNRQGFDGGFEPQFCSHKKLAELESKLYGHVIEAVDWDALANLEQFLFELLSKRNIGQSLAFDISKQMIEHSLRSAASDRMLGCDSVPFGITDEERRAVELDEDCPFCQFEVQLAKQRAKDAARPPIEEECCPLCDDMAAEWREEHAEILAKAGIEPPPHTPHGMTGSEPS